MSDDPSTPKAPANAHDYLSRGPVPDLVINDDPVAKLPDYLAPGSKLWEAVRQTLAITTASNVEALTASVIVAVAGALGCTSHAVVRGKQLAPCDYSVGHGGPHSNSAAGIVWAER